MTDLAAAFLAAGVRPGGALLLHSSLSSLRAAPGAPAPSPDAVLDALLQALGPSGTLLIPALSYLHVDAQRPAFDARSTPSNLGALPAAALRRAGALRSLHPTHSVVALGAQAAALTRDHGLDRTPVGPHSPFVLLCSLPGAQVGFLGCGTRCNTLIHGVEEALAAPPPYLLAPGTVAYSITSSEGVTEVAQHRRHDFAGWGQRYERLQGLVPPGCYSAAPLGRGALELYEARALWDTAREVLTRDALALVQRCPQGQEEAHHLVERVGPDGRAYHSYRVGPQ